MATLKEATAPREIENLNLLTIGPAPPEPIRFKFETFKMQPGPKIPMWPNKKVKRKRNA